MSWSLVHSVGQPCDRGGTLRRVGPLGLAPFRRESSPPCPANLGSRIGDDLVNRITAALEDVGLGYNPGKGPSPWLWCLGQPEAFIERLGPEDRADIAPDSCVDLILYVCDEHRVITIDAWPYGLVPARGGTGPEDPLTSTPIPLGDETSAARETMERLIPWLQEIGAYSDA